MWQGVWRQSSQSVDCLHSSFPSVSPARLLQLIGLREPSAGQISDLPTPLAKSQRFPACESVSSKAPRSGQLWPANARSRAGSQVARSVERARSIAQAVGLLDGFAKWVHRGAHREPPYFQFYSLLLAGDPCSSKCCFLCSDSLAREFPCPTDACPLGQGLLVCPPNSEFAIRNYSRCPGLLRGPVVPACTCRK